MGSGKGGSSPSQPTTQNVNSSSLPAYAEPYFKSMMDRAQAISNNPYVPYTGERQEAFSTQQKQAFDNVDKNVGNYQPMFDQASQRYQAASGYNPTQVTNTYEANGYTPQNWIDPNVASQYMSPYQQNVTDINKREAIRDYGQQQQVLNRSAQAGGAFGGYRQGIEASEATRNLNTGLQDIQDKGLQNAYSSGLAAFNQDRSSAMGANQLNNQYAQKMAEMIMAAQGANNQYGIQNAQLQADVGTRQQNLGSATQAAGQADVAALQQAGGAQQAYGQAGKDIAYQDFINQRDYDRQNMNWLSGILRGVPVQANSSTTGYTAPPSTTSQIAGLGLGAAGLAKMVG